MVYHSPEAILLLDSEHFKVLFSNKRADELFAEENIPLLGNNLPLGDECLEAFQEATEKACSQKVGYFRTKGLLSNPQRSFVFTLLPILEDGKVSALSCSVREADFLRRISSSGSALSIDNREPKRTFKQIRNRILLSLDKGRMTINQIGHSSSINWKTVEKHLTYLIGKKHVEEIFSSEYVRIFELTDRGKQSVERLKNEEVSKIIRMDESSSSSKEALNF